MVAVCVLAVSGGCTYLHSDARQAKAEAALETWKDIEANSPVGAMGVQFSGHAKTVEAISAAFQKMNSSVRGNALLSMKWDTLIDETDSAIGEVEGWVSSGAANRAALEKEIAEDLGALPEVKKKTAGALSALNEAEKARAGYEATLILLEKSIAAFATEDREKGAALVEEALAEKVGYPQWSSDDDDLALSSETKEKTVGELIELPEPIATAAGSLTADGKVPPDQVLAVLALLLERAEAREKDKKKQARIGSGLRLDSPGIATTIMSLGYDIARARQLRLQAEISYAKQMLKLQSQIVAASTTLLDAGLRKDAVTLKRLVETEVDLDKTPKVREGLEALTARARDQNVAEDERSEAKAVLAGAISIVGKSFDNRVHGMGSIELLTNQMERVRTEAQLARNAVDMNERGAFITRGLEGIAAFHRGGFNTESIDNIVQIAQAVGIGIIAGR